jgi:hypothetical protein
MQHLKHRIEQAVHQLDWAGLECLAEYADALMARQIEARERQASDAREAAERREFEEWKRNRSKDG